MYAIIEDGGRQYKVEEGQILDIDYRADESAVTPAGDVPPAGDVTPAGDEAAPRRIRFTRVLAVRDDNGLRLGKPTLEGAEVTADVVETTMGTKVYIQKFRRRKNYRRRRGHRQIYLRVKIAGIHAG
ncbi:MAG: 50S ribosomal protein L21 [Thermogutta sp.]|nr:50S ribosomal protein L21 [Thermogutta sp.]